MLKERQGSYYNKKTPKTIEAYRRYKMATKTKHELFLSKSFKIYTCKLPGN